MTDSLKLRILVRIVHCQTQRAVTYYRDEEHFAYGDTLPHTVVGVCGEFQRTGRFLQRGI